MVLKRWLDVDPFDWYYRNVVESQRLYMDAERTKSLIEGKTYNKFVTGHERKVHVLTSTENQTKFEIQGYKPHNQEGVYVYIDGVPAPVTKKEDNYIHIGQPIAGGLEVVIFLTGVVDSYMTNDQCQTLVLQRGCAITYPRIELERKDDYVFDFKYSLNEYAVCMGKNLRRITVDIRANEPLEDALKRTFGMTHDCYTILDGVLYVSYNLNGFPVYVNYNYDDGGTIKNRMREKAVPESDCSIYNDMFFPNVTMTRAEFFTILYRMGENFYNRYTDNGYTPNTINNTERYIRDRGNIVGKWYDLFVLNILDEKFLDGCYVFPLYEDDTFDPNGCVTRAEAVTYLHRFIEWALERFR